MLLCFIDYNIFKNCIIIFSSFTFNLKALLPLHQWRSYVRDDVVDLLRVYLALKQKVYLMVVGSHNIKVFKLNDYDFT